jgi:predicted RNase H-like HicB family nuclease
VIDLVQEFAVFLLETAVAYLIIQIVLNYFAIRFLKEEIEQHLESHAIPVTIEFDNDQYYCYNKQNKEFMAQGATYDEIKKRLQARFANCVVYIDGGDPAVIDRLLSQK